MTQKQQRSRAGQRRSPATPAPVLPIGSHRPPEHPALYDALRRAMERAARRKGPPLTPVDFERLAIEQGVGPREVAATLRHVAADMIREAVERRGAVWPRVAASVAAGSPDAALVEAAERTWAEWAELTRCLGRVLGDSTSRGTDPEDAA